MELLTAAQARNLVDAVYDSDVLEKTEELLLEIRHAAIKGQDYITAEFYKNEYLASKVIPKLNSLGYKTKQIEQYDSADSCWIEYTVEW